MKIAKTRLKQIIEEELKEGFMDRLTKPIFSKPPPSPEQKREEAEDLANTAFDDITNMIEDAPHDLEGMVVTLRKIKDEVSRILIWGDKPLFDMIKETKEKN